MKLRLITCIIYIALLPGILTGQSIDQIHFMTEEYPPFNMRINGELKGISIDLLMRILESMGSSVKRQDIKLLPWARGYLLAQDKPNTCLFVMTRNQSRENIFKWAGPISSTRIVAFALKSRNLRVSNKQPLQKLIAGVIQADIGNILAKEYGIINIQSVSSNESNIAKLLKQRIDIWIYEENVAKWQLRSLGFNVDDFEVVYELSTNELFYAFHKDTNSHLVNQFQEALDNFVKSGVLNTILKSYLN